MNINYEYYKIFYHAAKYKNLTQAAEELHNNQPNISRVIRLLEHEFGCQLMIRTNRGITLTPEGQKLYSHVKAAIEQFQTAEMELQSLSELEEGVITIGSSETALYMALLPALNKFKQSHSKIQIRIQNHLTSEAITSVRNGIVDFSVVTTPAIITKPLISTPIMEFRDILIGGTAYSDLSNPVSLKDICNLPLISLSENTMTYRFYSELYQKHHLIFRPELEAATTDQILPMVTNNLGIGFVPSVYASDAILNKQVVQINLKESIPARQICLVENSEHPLSVAASELKKELL